MSNIPKETSGAVQRWVMGPGDEEVKAPGPRGWECCQQWVKHEDCLQIERLLQDHIIDKQALRELVRDLNQQLRSVMSKNDRLDADLEQLSEDHIALRERMSDLREAHRGCNLATS